MFLEPDDLDGHGYFRVCLFLDCVAERFTAHRCWFEAKTFQCGKHAVFLALLMLTDGAAASNTGPGWQLAITTVAGAGSSVGPSNKKQRTDEQTNMDAAASQKPTGKGKGGKGKQRRPAMDDQVLASIARLTLQGAQQHRSWEASLLDTFLLPTSSSDRHFDETGGTSIPPRGSERVGRPTSRAGPTTRTRLSSHGRITGDSDAGHESRAGPAHDSEPAGTVDEHRHSPADGSWDHDGASLQNQARGGHKTPVPSPGRNRSVGPQSRTMHHRSATHGGYRPTEPS